MPFAYSAEQHVVHRGRAGVQAGLFGCIFGVLGIFTLGFVFVPLAALCSFVGLIRGVFGVSASGRLIARQLDTAYVLPFHSFAQSFRTASKRWQPHYHHRQLANTQSGSCKLG
jgi:hypothetical protein